MRVDVVSIFPDYLEPLKLSLVGKAIETGLVDLAVHDLRDWTHDRHRRVDDTPYGGGAGMVMKPEPWGEALDALAPGDAEPRPRLLIMTPSGRPFDQAMADELAAEDHLIFACGRYEGIDARVVEHAQTKMAVDEVSIGDYVLNGGEVAAMVIIEAVLRLIPGVIGNPESLTEESHSAGHDRLLEYPVYTKPPSWRGLDVPEILFSGHHAKITAWRREQAEALTRTRRPDLLSEQEVIITAAVAADVGELVTLQRAAFLSEGRAHQTTEIPPLTETLDEAREAFDERTILVARLGNRIVGSVRASATAADNLGGSRWAIGRLMVAPDLQGKGIGDRLLTAIEEAAPADCRQFELWTGAKSIENHAFYRRRGYDQTSEQAHPGADVIVLTKDRPLP